MTKLRARDDLPGPEAPGDAMNKEMSTTWPTEDARDLFEAILLLRTRDEVERFFRDLCTMSELQAMAHRWHAARLLDQEVPYLEIARITGASTATVTRVAQWLRRGEDGYRLVLERMARKRSRKS
jgi:TrpR-related protein YerC/YecD